MNGFLPEAEAPISIKAWMDYFDKVEQDPGQAIAPYIKGLAAEPPPGVNPQQWAALINQPGFAKKLGTFIDENKPDLLLIASTSLLVYSNFSYMTDYLHKASLPEYREAMNIMLLQAMSFALFFGEKLLDTTRASLGLWGKIDPRNPAKRKIDGDPSLKYKFDNFGVLAGFILLCNLTLNGAGFAGEALHAGHTMDIISNVASHPSVKTLLDAVTSKEMIAITREVSAIAMPGLIYIKMQSLNLNDKDTKLVRTFLDSHFGGSSKLAKMFGKDFYSYATAAILATPHALMAVKAYEDGNTHKMTFSGIAAVSYALFVAYMSLSKDKSKDSASPAVPAR
jgi:hypothetical protein